MSGQVITMQFWLSCGIDTKRNFRSGWEKGTHLFIIKRQSKVTFGSLAASGERILSVGFGGIIADGYRQIRSFRIIPSLTKKFPQSRH
jgi:hypothetical protein